MKIFWANKKSATLRDAFLHILTFISAWHIKKAARFRTALNYCVLL